MKCFMAFSSSSHIFFPSCGTKSLAFNDLQIMKYANRFRILYTDSMFCFPGKTVITQLDGYSMPHTNQAGSGATLHASLGTHGTVPTAGLDWWGRSNAVRNISRGIQIFLCVSLVSKPKHWLGRFKCSDYIWKIQHKSFAISLAGSSFDLSVGIVTNGIYWC